MRKLIYAALLFLPWPLRRLGLVHLLGFKIDAGARIGLAWILPESLEMGPGSRIGHLTVCKGLTRLTLGLNASLGRGNWITGFPRGGARHFLAEPDRCPELLVADHAAITNRHIIDCTNRVAIGEFTTFAGFRSQILTHSIDLSTSRQGSAPVTIGSHCFIGTGAIVLPGAVLPDHSVLGAASLLNRAYSTPYRLYGGVPATEISILDVDLAYFHREAGFVD